MVVFQVGRASVRNGRVTGQRVAETLSAFVRDAAEFLASNPLLLVVLAALAVVFFQMTRPRVR